MKIGMIGLGKMGGNMAERLIRGGHGIVGYARHEEAVRALEEKGGTGAGSIGELTGMLDTPRVVWIMVPAGRPVDSVIEELFSHLDKGDIIIDGGNSRYTDTKRRAAALRDAGLNMVDVGTSGGVWGLAEGYSMMVGGEKETVEILRPILETLAPAPDMGWGHVGPSGAGHFVKMVHNGIEYGMMQAFAEGFAIMKAKDEFDIDLHNVSGIWRYGSVVRSWLLDLIADALDGDQELPGIAPFVSDSGEGRWTAIEAIDLGVPAPVISLALSERFRSQNDNSYADRLLAAMRNKFGGHEVKSR
ncbi:MAG: decarboxylating 6-phosphogluconate dehydrogenase [Candidatus Krumholzibacteria bacterium]|nr:decarboxylating 6-phosphogluconate dehydrogenase [Candidatus Krumholzibacteria bacterium]